MKRSGTSRFAVYTAAIASVAGLFSARSSSAALVADWVGDSYTTGANWTSSVGGFVGTGSATAVTNAFGTHKGVNVNTNTLGFTLPKGASINDATASPPGGLSSYTIAAAFDPTASAVTGGAVYQARTIIGFDIANPGTADFGLAYGGAGNGRHIIAGIGATTNDQSITSADVTLNLTHSAVFQVNNAGGAGNGYISLWVDGQYISSTYGLTIPTLNPSAAAGNFGLGGKFVGVFPGLLGEVQVYNDATPDGAALSQSLLSTYGSSVKLYSWTGGTGNYSTTTNWDLAAIPNSGTNARARISNGGTAQLAATTSLFDLYVGDYTGTKTGSMSVTGGTLTVNNSFTVGHWGGTGTFDIGAGALNYTGSTALQINGNATTAATFNAHGSSSVQLTGSANLVVGEGVQYLNTFFTGNGHLILANTPTLTVSSGQLWIGDNNSTGVVDMSGGTLSVSNFIAVGRNGGTGTFNLSGGTLLKPVGTPGAITFASKGTLTQTGGTITATDSQVYLAENAGNTATWNMSAGAANINDARIGMAGVGTLNMSGTATLGAQYMTIAPTTTGTGTWTMSGVTANVVGNVYAGESGTGVLTLNNGSVLNAGTVTVGNALSANATVNLNNGAKIVTSSISRGAGAVAFNLNGGTIQATTDNADFFSAFKASDANLLAGGLTIDSNGHNITSSSGFSGSGGLTKAGLGTLMFSDRSASTFTGTTTISGGTIKLSHTVAGNSIKATDIAGYYKFNSAAGLFLDSSGHGNTVQDSLPGTAQFSTAAPAGHAGSLALPVNSDDYLSTASGLAPANFPLGNSSYTIAAWVNLDGARNDSDGIIGWGGFGIGGNNNTNGLRTAATNGALLNYWWNNDLQGNIPQGGGLVGSWHYVAATYDQATNTRTLYEDGVTLGTDNPVTAAAVTNLNFAIGAANLGGSEYFSGNMADLLIANSAVSKADLIDAAANGVTIGATLIDTKLSPNSLVAIAGTASLDLGGTNQTVAGLADFGGGGGTVSTTFAGPSIITLVPSGTRTFSGAIQNGAGLLAVTVSGGTQVLSGVSSYTGNTSVTAGTLTIAPTGSLASPAISTSMGATLNANGTTNAGLATNSAVTSNGTINIAANVGNTGITKVVVASVSLGITGSFVMADPGLANHANRKVLVTNSLIFAGNTNAWGGSLNLTTNDMVVHNGNLSAMTNQIKQAYANGAWTGNAGIFTNLPGTDRLHTLGIATGLTSVLDQISLVASDVFVKYTYYGDSDLDGAVTGNDYTLIDFGFSHAGTSGWQNGDYNYDGHIDGSDYSLIDNTFNTQPSSLALNAGMMAVKASEVAVTTLTAVPEPGSLAFAGLSVVVALRGSRRRKNNRVPD